MTGLRPEKEADYRNFHSHVWPGVISAIGDSGIPRFDLYLIEFGDALYLVYSFDYRGTDFDGDMAKMAANPVNKRWWKFTDACQSPLPQTKKGIWEPMEPVTVPAKDAK
jgi:L-rhamnose mutarotase